MIKMLNFKNFTNSLESDNISFDMLSEMPFNESSKPPLFEEGDYVMLTSGIYRRKWKTSSTWDRSDKFQIWREEGGGALCKVVKVEGAGSKSFYTLELIEGYLILYNSRYYKGSSSAIANNSYLIGAEQKQLTKEGVEEFMKLVKNKRFNNGEEISAKGADKSITAEIVAVAVGATLEKKAIYYKLKNVSNNFPETSLEPEFKIGAEEIEVIANEISKKLNVKIYELEDNRVIFNVKRINLSEKMDGFLFVKDTEKEKEFSDELKKLIEKYVTPEFQKIMKEGNAVTFRVKEPNSDHKLYKGSINNDKLNQAARTLGIDVKELLQRKRGIVSGKKFGL